jgi:hypothetical protein
MTQKISRHHLFGLRGAAGNVFRVIGETHQLLIRLWQPTLRRQVPETFDRRLSSLRRADVAKTG